MIFGIKNVYNTDVYQKRMSYEVVGFLLLIRLLVSLKHVSDSILQDQTEKVALSLEHADSTTTDIDAKKCSLCLDKRNNPTCAECGHVFCWKCITDWVSYDQKCPLCRRTLKPSRFVLLANYR